MHETLDLGGPGEGNQVCEHEAVLQGPLRAADDGIDGKALVWLLQHDGGDGGRVTRSPDWLS